MSRNRFQVRSYGARLYAQVLQPGQSGKERIRQKQPGFFEKPPAFF
jgi:hypothetical protein